MKCIKNGSEIVHSWKCTCKEFYWDTEKGRKDVNYNTYLTKRKKTTPIINRRRR